MKVELYTKAFCPYCERAKELLRIKGVPFVEYVVNGDPLRIEEMRRRGAAERFPGIFIADRPIGGCGELFDLDESGALDRLLAITPGLPR
ncbi:MAG: glutaredoxin 3 [Deltaproteobacteria bacterium]|nr:MAG: glutaredoxin 3 [Deltaproteobacteria bacterium]